MEYTYNQANVDVKSKEYLEWVEKSTIFGPISNVSVRGCNNYTSIPLLYGMVDNYFKENKGVNICSEFGGFYQCYRVKYNGNGYLIGRRDNLCGDYRIARYRYSDDLVDLEEIQSYIKEHVKCKVKKI